MVNPALYKYVHCANVYEYLSRIAVTNESTKVINIFTDLYSGLIIFVESNSPFFIAVL